MIIIVLLAKVLIFPRAREDIYWCRFLVFDIFAS